MSPPTSIDGTDITGATIDGTDVQEITVDGQTVFTAETLPVAYSNLIAWYPFDSSFYGGSNADDATALFNSGQSGDSTAYDGTVSGATYQSSGGVTDIKAGANSGAFDFDGSNDYISTGINNTVISNPLSICAWFDIDSTGRNPIVSNRLGTGTTPHFVFRYFGGANVFIDPGAGAFAISGPDDGVGAYHHMVFTSDGSTMRLYYDGNPTPVDSRSSNVQPFGISQAVDIGRRPSGNEHFDGALDDVRIYNKALSGSEVSQIYNNTKP